MLNVKAIPCLRECYWNRPEAYTATGDPKNDAIYISVGRSLSEWERLEQELATLFLTVTEARNTSVDPVRRAFGAVESGSVRRTMINEAAEVHFGGSWQIKTVRTSFLAITTAVMHASKRRDEIAHGIANNPQIDQTDYGWFLFPAYYNSGRTQPSGPPDAVGPPEFWLSDYRYTSAQIDAFTEKFAVIAKIVWQVANLTVRRDGAIPFVEAVTGSKPV